MMASACVKCPAMPPPATESCFLDRSLAAYTSYGWLSPRISFRCNDKSPSTPSPENADDDFFDFEFRLADGAPVAMLPADQLFSGGKLVPLHLAARPSAAPEIRSPDPAVRSRRRVEICGSRSDPYLLSPRAPRCTTSWRELLGLKRQQTHKPESQKPSSAANKSAAARSLKHHFLHRNSPKSEGLPLLRDSDPDLLSHSSRRSLSSSPSSSGGDHDDLPRLSLFTEKPGQVGRNLPRMLAARPVSSSEGNARAGRSPVRRAAPPVRGASVDSPRMNASGRVVFEGLERSSSSPGSFTGGPRPRLRPRGMERSYSANVRVTHVLNVPVCSLRGSGRSVFGQLFFSPQKKERENGQPPASAAARSGGSRIKIQRTSIA